MNIESFFDIISNSFIGIVIIILVIFLIKITFWLEFKGHAKSTEEYLKNLDENFVEHHDTIKKQNEKIIQLLEDINKKI